MGIARRRAYVRMVQCPLHKLEVLGLAQQLAAEVVPEVMKPEALHASALTQSSPLRLYSAIAERVAPPLDVTVTGVPGHIVNTCLG